MEHPKKEVIQNLKALIKTYDGLTNEGAKRKQRLCHMGIDPKHDDILMGWETKNNKYFGLEGLKGRVNRKIEKELVFWPIWSKWLVNVPGIGPIIAAKLMFLFYYKMIPICQKCGADIVKKDESNYCPVCEKSLKGEGLTPYRLGYKEFQNPSAWRKYMGEHIIDGKKPKRAKGVVCDWSTDGRTLSYLIGESFIKTKCLYRDFYDKRKSHYQNSPDHKEHSKMHINNMCRTQASKLFLSHFWDVDQRLQGVEKPALPWIIALGGHSKYIEPYYYKEQEDEMPEIDGYLVHDEPVEVGIPA